MKVTAYCNIMGKQHCAQTQDKETWYHIQDCLSKKITSLMCRKPNPIVGTLQPMGFALAIC